MPRPKSREQRMAIGLLNVVAHPTTIIDRYENLIQRAAQAMIPIRYYGNRWGYIAAYEKTSEGYIAGTVNTFLDFDRSKPWFDKIRQAILDEDELEQSVPEHLKPEFNAFNFLLVPQFHRVLIDLREVTISNAQKIFFQQLCSKKIYEPLGLKSVEVYVEQSKEGLEKILNLERIEELIIVCRRPNSDSLHEFEEQIDELMEEQNAREYRQEWKADRSGPGFVPNKETTDLAHVSRSYGFTYAKGYVKGENRSTPHSTENLPLIEHIMTVPEEETAINALRRNATRVISKVKAIDDDERR